MYRSSFSFVVSIKKRKGEDRSKDLGENGRIILK
jgi:hypothetical protein